MYPLRIVKIDSLPQFLWVNSLGVAGLGASDLKALGISHLQVSLEL